MREGTCYFRILVIFISIPVLSGSLLKDKKNAQDLVLGTLGQTTYLNCIVGNIGDREVSWLRTRDLRILTIGKIRYTEDPRFQPLHTEGNDLWALKIRNASFEDQEKKLKWPVRLRILDSHAVIPGNQERHVKARSRLLLRCFIEKSSGPPSFIYWYHNGNVMNYSDRQGVTIRTLSESESTLPSPSLRSSSSASRKRNLKRKRNNHPASVLTINRVTAKDSGNYTCSPSNAKNHTVQVHIVQVQLAMQRETGSKLTPIKAVEHATDNTSSSYSTRKIDLSLALYVHLIYVTLLLT
ncbi:unnamed protein product [Lepeophtheirus salmonis]|uniref:(salmon louse) hypothetical protein n=1 Tax=Lepeophtheirus salmonis TaxID=72036 RepID=A0A7R8H3G8_LEPSM|nr:unnamed protein product [Lepeophtheirus salmonis]CAF2845894.1 unnamed protein product [Lepeophtheirus salmonis]